MNVWDWAVTLMKVFLMVGLSYFYGSHLTGIFFYALLVALPLMIMRWSAGFTGSGVSLLCFALVGMDLFCAEKSRA
jgi:hypothetical protein